MSQCNPIFHLALGQVKGVLCQQFLIEHSENKLITQSGLFNNQVGPVMLYRVERLQNMSTARMPNAQK